MFNWWEKINGHSKIPMRTSVAVRNGAELKAGSSAMLRSRTIKLQEKSDKLTLPSFTSRPSVAVSCFSIAGRNEFALTSSKINKIATTKRQTSAKRVFVKRFKE